MNTNFLVQVFQWGVKSIIKNVKFYYQVEYKNIKLKEKVISQHSKTKLQNFLLYLLFFRMLLLLLV